MRSKKVFIGLIIVIVAITGIFLFFRGSEDISNTNSDNASGQKTVNTADNIIRIAAAGDFLPHDSVNLNAQTQNGYDYRQFFEPIKTELDGADIVFCNQESPSAPNLSVSGFPVFNAPREFAADLSETGCNVISVANNHLFDKGQEGINGTRRVWDDLDALAVSGANRSQSEQDKVSYFEVEGVRFAFVAFTEISNQDPAFPFSLNFLKEDLVRKLISEAENNADLVIVSAHWGTEYSPDVNKNQEEWSQTFTNLGADLIFGHGPHVIQPVNRLEGPGGNQAVVFYSLGNLLSTQLDIESLTGGLALIDVDKNTKKFKSATFYPTYMHYEWTAQEKAAEDLLKRKNLKIYPLSTASEQMEGSHHQTTSREQVKRIAGILNKYIGIDVKN